MKVWTVAIVAAAALLWPQAARAEAPGPVLPKLIDRDVQKAIDRGINYLVKTQRNDGSWLNSGGYGSYPAVMTGLAGMALMGNGSTPESGRHAKNTRKAMMALLHMAESSSDGLIAGGSSGSEGQSMYGHGFGMLFLAQCYGVENSADNEERLRKVLEKGVQLTAKCQSDKGAQYKHAGGWYYTPQSGGDEGSVTVTQLQALRACRNVGLKVPKSTIDRAVEYLRQCQQSDGGICYMWSTGPSGSRPALSAAGIACFHSAGIYEKSGDTTEAKMAQRLMEYCRKNVLNQEANGHDFYTLLYMCQVMYQRSGSDEKAQAEWDKYYASLKQRLLGQQSPDGSWNDGTGSTYATAIACMLLQLPYGYTPIFQR